MVGKFVQKVKENQVRKDRACVLFRTHIWIFIFVLIAACLTVSAKDVECIGTFTPDPDAWYMYNHSIASTTTPPPINFCAKYDNLKCSISTWTDVNPKLEGFKIVFAIEIIIMLVALTVTMFRCVYLQQEKYRNLEIGVSAVEAVGLIVAFILQGGLLQKYSTFGDTFETPDIAGTLLIMINKNEWIYSTVFLLCSLAFASIDIFLMVCKHMTRDTKSYDVSIKMETLPQNQSGEMIRQYSTQQSTADLLSHGVAPNKSFAKPLETNSSIPSMSNGEKGTINNAYIQDDDVEKTTITVPHVESGVANGSFDNMVDTDETVTHASNEGGVDLQRKGD